MAVNKTFVGAMQIPMSAQLTEVTLSAQSLCHYIRDDELERLGEMKKEPVMEIFLCTIGVFLGALIPSLKVLGDLSTIDSLGMIVIAISIAAFSISSVTGVLWYQRAKSHKSLVETIRDRPRVALKVAIDST